MQSVAEKATLLALRMTVHELHRISTLRGVSKKARTLHYEKPFQRKLYRDGKTGTRSIYFFRRFLSFPFLFFFDLGFDLGLAFPDEVGFDLLALSVDLCTNS